MMGAKLFTAAITAIGAFSTRNRTTSSRSFSSCSSKTGRKPRNASPKRLTTPSISNPNVVEKGDTTVDGIEWADEQKQVLAQVRRGSSVFITGSAGSGKTLLLQYIIGVLEQVHGPQKVFVTASTGVAACAIRGQTVHSFAAIGFGKADRDTLLDRVLLNKAATKRWKKVKALVIDEVSMVDAEMFENLEFIARQVKGSKKVWGGIQLLVSGDFFQLPPITSHYGKQFAFEADCWDASFDVQIELKKIFRQSDPRLIKLLHGMRKGKSDAEDLEVLKESCLLSNESDSSVVRLYPRIEDVKRVNNERMASLAEQSFTYKARDGGIYDFKQGIVPDQLQLCRGARVMLIKNLDTKSQLCNGAAGTVTSFVLGKQNNCLGEALPLVRFDSGIHMIMKPERWEIVEGGKIVAWREQIPLILAWALSVHKCQGMTLDSLHTDLSRAFGYGMVYVALSRVRSLEGLSLSGFSPSKIKAHPKVVDFYERLASNKLVNDEEDDGGTKKIGTEQ